MNVQSRALSVVLAALFLLAPLAASSQSARDQGRGILATLKPGHWVRVDGIVQDRSVLCSEVKLLTGDFLDGDWSVRGVVGSIEPQKRRLEIGPYSVVVSEKAAFESQVGRLERFSDLKVGMRVEVEGSYRRDGTFLADEVDRQEPGSPAEKRIQVVAKVERIDLSKRQISAMGTLFQVVDKTRLKSVLR